MCRVEKSKFQSASSTFFPGKIKQLVCSIPARSATTPFFPTHSICTYPHSFYAVVAFSMSNRGVAGCRCPTVLGHDKCIHGPQDMLRHANHCAYTMVSRAMISAHCFSRTYRPSEAEASVPGFLQAGFGLTRVLEITKSFCKAPQFTLTSLLVWICAFPFFGGGGGGMGATGALFEGWFGSSQPHGPKAWLPSVFG